MIAKTRDCQLHEALRKMTTDHQKPGLPACAGNDDSGAVESKPNLATKHSGRRQGR
jgi:hypothetical protein